MAWKSGDNWSVDIDESKDRAYLVLDGRLEGREAAAAADATIAAAERLEDGWELINDLSMFNPSDPEAMEHIERGKQGIARNGVEAVVRVMAESTTGQMQFDRAGEEEESYQLAMADSIEKAEKLLDKRRQKAQ